MEESVMEKSATSGDGGEGSLGRTRRSVRSCLGGAQLGSIGRHTLELGQHEGVEVAVEHGRGGARLVVGAMVLDHLIGVEHIRADLVAPAGLDMLATQLCELALAILDAPFEQPG